MQTHPELLSDVKVEGGGANASSSVGGWAATIFRWLGASSPFDFCIANARYFLVYNTSKWSCIYSEVADMAVFYTFDPLLSLN